MTLGVILLVHTALGRAVQVARHWADSGCPVVIHADRKVPAKEFNGMIAALADLDNVYVLTPRHRCEWGTWGIVGATLDATDLMLEAAPDVSHVMLTSGSCLPLRPLPELQRYLHQHSDTDFIESVAIEHVAWSKGGFDKERFSLRFPFSYKRSRFLFERYVRLQRMVGFRRALPEGVQPHLGSQWWCLTRKTLSAILRDPQRRTYDRFFKRVWIPDESYFQSLARNHSRILESRSLTLSKFDFQGKPHTFYDDHLQLLRRSDCFVARKIWPQANRLYGAFLSNDPRVTKNAEPNPGKIDRLFSRAAETRVRGRAGLYMQSRFPNPMREVRRTAEPYSVFSGFDQVFEGFPEWLSKATGNRVHGHLFAPEGAEFSGAEPIYNGSLSQSAALRDYNPQAFLAGLIWATRGERQCFQFAPTDCPPILPFVVGDPNAQVSVITGAWALGLFRSGLSEQSLHREAARMQRAELVQLDVLRASWARARIRIWTLSDFLDTPIENLQPILDEISPRSPRRLTEAPILRAHPGFADFVQRLRNDGLNPHLAGDFHAADKAQLVGAPASRPYLVK